MAVDTTLRYGTFNTYLLGDGEWLHADPFDVENYSHITVQAVVIRLDGQAITNARFTGRWLDADGKKLGSEINYGYTTTNKFQRITQTWAVPTNAVKIAWRIEGGYGGYHVACPMIEPGQIASSFDPSVAAAVAWHDAYGSYVGFLSANQIIAGILRSVLGNSGFNLDEARIWMTSQDGEITWEATPQNPLVIKNKQGTVLGGLALINNVVSLITNALADDPASGKYVKLGEWTAPADDDRDLEARPFLGIRLFLPSYSTTNPIMALGVATLYGQSWVELHHKGKVILYAGEDIFNVFVDDAKTYLTLVGYGDGDVANAGLSFRMGDDNGDVASLYVGDVFGDGSFQINANDCSIWADSGAMEAEFSLGDRAWGIDSTGVYKRSGSTITYW